MTTMMMSSCRKLAQNFLPKLRWSSSSSRVKVASYSTQNDNFLDVSIDNEGIAVVKMQKPPVNSLSLEMLQSISKMVKDLENDKTCKGMILTSAIPNIFSGGLEITEMYQPKEDRFRSFWNSLQQMWIDLYLSKLVTVAVVTGHAPAAGCLVALSCDYRIMVNSKYGIGLNETALGIVAPYWFQDMFQKAVGHRESEIGLCLGKLYRPEEALEKHIVDKLAGSAEEALEEAKTEIKKWIKIPTLARQLTKQQIREEAVKRLVKVRDQETDSVTALVKLSITQKSLGVYLDSLKRKG